MKRLSLTIALLLGTGSLCLAEAGKPLILREPSVSRTQIVFSYAGTLWIANRDGGEARRLTTGGHESNPIFSPDGALIAFTGEYDGNVDVNVVAAVGGSPRRLTYHPDADVVVGWTPDGKQVLFRSARNGFAAGVVQLFTIPVEGGFPEPVPLVRASEGCYSPDGSRLAYVPNIQWQRAW